MKIALSACLVATAAAMSIFQPLQLLCQTDHSPPPSNAAATSTQTAGDKVLGPADLQQLLPPTVFFKGQSAPLQLRNAGGVRFTDGAFFFSALVDASGYSSSIQEKYQAYLITETPIEFAGHTLAPGAYGVGFIADNKFLVMDIGGHDLFTVESMRDEALHHPTPLRVERGATDGVFRLYEGRVFVTFQHKP